MLIEKEVSPLYHLPHELWLLIMSYLEHSEKLKMRLITKHLKNIVENESLWISSHDPVKSSKLYDFTPLIEKGLSSRLQEARDKGYEPEKYNDLIKRIQVATEEYQLKEEKITELLENAEKIKSSFDLSIYKKIKLITIRYLSLPALAFILATIYLVKMEKNKYDIINKCDDLYQFDGYQQSPLSDCQNLLEEYFKNFFIGSTEFSLFISAIVKLADIIFLQSQLLIDRRIDLTLKNVENTKTTSNCSKITKILKYRDYISLVLAAALAITFVTKPLKFDINKCLEMNQNTTVNPAIYEYQLNSNCLNSMMKNLESNALAFGILEGFFLAFGIVAIFQIMHSMYHQTANKIKNFNTNSNFFRPRTSARIAEEKDEQTLLLENNEHRVSYA